MQHCCVGSSEGFSPMLKTHAEVRWGSTRALSRPWLPSCNRLRAKNRRWPGMTIVINPSGERVRPKEMQKDRTVKPHRLAINHICQLKILATEPTCLVVTLYFQDEESRNCKFDIKLELALVQVVHRNWADISRCCSWKWKADPQAMRDFAECFSKHHLNPWLVYLLHFLCDSLLGFHTNIALKTHSRAESTTIRRA